MFSSCPCGFPSGFAASSHTKNMHSGLTGNLPPGMSVCADGVCVLPWVSGPSVILFLYFLYSCFLCLISAFIKISGTSQILGSDPGTRLKHPDGDQVRMWVQSKRPFMEGRPGSIYQTAVYVTSHGSWVTARLPVLISWGIQPTL